jgi:DNA-binding GntR family transcriptional regulator
LWDKQELNILKGIVNVENVVRRSAAWVQSRDTTGPAANYCSFDEHEAIEARGANLAEARMRDHLISVRDRVLASRDVGPAKRSDL